MARKPKITLHGPNSSNGPAPKRQAPLPRPSTPVQAGARVFKTASSSQIEKRAGNASFAKQLQGVSRQKIQAVFGPKPGAKISDVRARNMSREYDSMRKAGATHAEAVRSAAEIYDVTQKDSAAAISRGKSSRTAMNVTGGNRQAAKIVAKNMRDAREAKSAASATERAKAIERNATRSSASPADQIDAKIKQINEKIKPAYEKADKAGAVGKAEQKYQALRDERLALINEKMAIANAPKSADGFSESKDLTGKTEKYATGGKGADRAVVTPTEDGKFLATSETSSPGAVHSEGHGKYDTLEEAKAAAKAGLVSRTNAQAKIEQKMAAAADPNARAERENAELDKFDYKGEHFNEKMFTPAEIEQSLTEAGVPAHQAGPIRRNMELMSGDKKWSPQQILDEYSGRVDPEKLKRAMAKAKAKASGGSGHWDEQPRVPAGNPDGGQWTEG